MTIYKSQLSLIVFLPLLIVMIILGWIAVSEHVWGLLGEGVIVLGLFFYLYKTTYYTIDGNILNIHLAFLFNRNIEISQIKSITETKSMLSAPAWGSNRIEIWYNKYDSVVISPPDIAQFIADLQAINPGITTTWKNKK